MKNNKKQSGFTLIELLVVIGIISILTATGIGVYGQYRHYQRVKTAAVQTQGLIMEAQSLAKASKEKQNIIYEVRITSTGARLQALKLHKPSDDITVGTIDRVDYSVEPISGKDIKFGIQVKLANFKFVNGSKDNLHSIAAVVPSGRLLFDLREPDLRQGNQAKDNLYNPLALPAWQGANSYAKITFSNKDDRINYKKMILVYGISSKIEFKGQ